MLKQLERSYGNTTWTFVNDADDRDDHDLPDNQGGREISEAIKWGHSQTIGDRVHQNLSQKASFHSRIHCFLSFKMTATSCG